MRCRLLTGSKAPEKRRGTYHREAHYLVSMRSVSVMVALALVLTACAGGDGGKQQSGLRPSGTADAAATSSSSGPANAREGDSAVRERAGDLETSASRSQTLSSNGGVKQPRLGTYEYALSGTYSLGSNGGPTAYPKGLTMSVDYVGKDVDPQETGPQFTSRSKFEAAGETTMTITQWEPRRVLLLYTNIVSDEENSCTYQPPLEIMRMPIALGKLPRQSWSASGCSGSLNVEVLRRQDISTAGRRWKAWKIRYRLEYVLGTLQGTRTDIVWFSPKLGTEVKIDRRVRGTDGGDTYEAHQIMYLRRYPS